MVLYLGEKEVKDISLRLGRWGTDGKLVYIDWGMQIADVNPLTLDNCLRTTSDLVYNSTNNKGRCCLSASPLGKSFAEGSCRSVLHVNILG